MRELRRDRRNSPGGLGCGVTGEARAPQGAGAQHGNGAPLGRPRQPSRGCDQSQTGDARERQPPNGGADREATDERRLDAAEQRVSLGFGHLHEEAEERCQRRGQRPDCHPAGDAG
jgi:hypothetical protein